MTKPSDTARTHAWRDAGRYITHADDDRDRIVDVVEGIFCSGCHFCAGRMTSCIFFIFIVLRCYLRS